MAEILATDGAEVVEPAVLLCDLNGHLRLVLAAVHRFAAPPVTALAAAVSQAQVNLLQSGLWILINFLRIQTRIQLLF